MSRGRRATLVAGVLLVLAGVGLVTWRLIDDASSGAGDVPAGTAAVVSGVGDAKAPFRDLTAGTITVGGVPVEVVVADSLGERSQGLRGRADASPYAGMLFVFEGDSTAAFTMAGVPAPLEIAFFDARGRRVDELRMEPCAGSDATCPLYRSAAPYRYALETAPGDMPAGRLRVPA